MHCMSYQHVAEEASAEISCHAVSRFVGSRNFVEKVWHGIPDLERSTGHP